MKYFKVAALSLLGLNMQVYANKLEQSHISPEELTTKKTTNIIRINGTYATAPQPGEKVYLAILLDKKTKQFRKVDSANVQGTHFSLVPPGLQPGKFELMNTAGESFPLYLEYGQSNILIESKFSQAKVSGNTLDSLLKKYEAMNMMVAMAQMGYAFKAMAYQDKGKEVPKEEEEAFIKNFTEISDSQKKLTRELGARKDLVGAYVLANGGASLFTNSEINGIYAALSTVDKQTPFGLALKSFADKLNSLEVGVRAPDFVQKTTEGTDLRLSEFIKGKKLILVDFWASWCGPCRKENPHVVALYEKFKGKGFDVLGVSLDDKKENWLKAIAEDKLSWAQVSDLGGWNNEVAKQYNVAAVPHTVLINGNGVIVAKNLRGEELAKKVAELCK